MFKAVLVQWIYIRCDDETKGPGRGMRWRYRLEHEFDLPFVPQEGTLFYDGDDEISVEHAHFDLREGRFIVDVGGGLSEDEADAKSSLDYEMSKGWIVSRERIES